jgi:uncharacterized phage protein gp47/JayE
MSSPTSAVVTSTGISAPSLQSILAYFIATAQTIFGSDIYIAPDSQDGQLIAAFAQAVSDANAVAISVYNSFSPQLAQGTALSSNVAINGITRNVATNSQVNVVIVGVVGTIIAAGIVADTNGNQYALPNNVEIPPGGSTVVTATAVNTGSISSLAGTVTQIINPTNGWQSVTNPAASVPGAPIETDAELMARQAESVEIPSLSALDGIEGAVAAVTGVTASKSYENDTNITDAYGNPPHSISVVAQGGSATAIAQAIAVKKTPGAYTNGTTSEIVNDTYGIPHTIRFTVPSTTNVAVAITVHALSGYTSTIGTEIQAAVASYINGLGIGTNVAYTKVFVPANLSGTGNGTDGNTFEITAMTINGGTSDITVAWNSIASCTGVTLTVS